MIIYQVLLSRRMREEIAMLFPSDHVLNGPPVTDG